MSSSEYKDTVTLDVSKLTTTETKGETSSSIRSDIEEDTNSSQSNIEREEAVINLSQGNITGQIHMTPLNITEKKEDINRPSQSTDKGKQTIITEKEEDIDRPSQSTYMMYPEEEEEEEEEPLGPPRPDLLTGSRNDYVDYCVPLFRASITQDWDAAKLILDKRPELVRYAITEDLDTPLHVAASTGTADPRGNFVKNLLGMMKKGDLARQNRNSNTALWLAAAGGNVNIARTMINMNRDLLHIRGSEGLFPLHAAAMHEKYEMVRCLIDDFNFLTREDANDWTPIEKGHFLEKCIECDFFDNLDTSDIAMRVVNAYPELLIRNCDFILTNLAGKPNALYSVKRSIIKRIFRFAGPTEYDSDALILLKDVWKSVVEEKHKKEIDTILRGRPDVAVSDQTSNIRRYSSRILFIAAETGNTRFLVELFQSYPDLIWSVNDDKHSIFHIAIMRRHQGIYNLLYEVGSLKDQIIYLKDQDENNMLHLVGKTSKEMRPHMVEASLVMQRELLWFKAVEKILSPKLRNAKNKAGETPYELFSENNKDIVSQGLKWMKECMVVATLIVTVAFAVAFTVPGGYHQTYGRPYFLKRSTFIVFVIADGICLFSSTASLLMFLSILTSRYNQRHFIYSLPNKLMVALFLLFISVLAMMVTFSASFFVLYHNGLRWIPFLISGFVAFPVIIFAMLQIPVLLDISRSVYDNRYLFNPRGRMLFPKT